MQLFGAKHFDDYERNLKRVLWAELIDRQLMAKRRQNFKATLVGDPYAPRPVLSSVIAETQAGPALTGPDPVLTAVEIAARARF